MKSTTSKLLLALLVCSWLYIIIDKSTYLKKYDEKNIPTTITPTEADSLNDEIFNLQSINGRYEMALEHLKEVNPKAADEFEKYYNQETE